MSLCKVFFVLVLISLSAFAQENDDGRPHISVQYEVAKTVMGLSYNAVNRLDSWGMTHWEEILAKNSALATDYYTYMNEIKSNEQVIDYHINRYMRKGYLQKPVAVTILRRYIKPIVSIRNKHFLYTEIKIQQGIKKDGDKLAFHIDYRSDFKTIYLPVRGITPTSEDFQEGEKVLAQNYCLQLKNTRMAMNESQQKICDKL